MGERKIKAKKVIIFLSVEESCRMSELDLKPLSETFAQKPSVNSMKSSSELSAHFPRSN